jgi:hypothetical protein
MPAIERPRPPTARFALIRRNDTIPRMTPGMSRSGSTREHRPRTNEVVAMPFPAGTPAAGRLTGQVEGGGVAVPVPPG